MARVHRPRQGGKSGRMTQWIGPADQGYVAVNSTVTTILASFAFLEAATIVRIRGQASVKLQTYGADLDIVGAVGIGLVSDEAFAAGVASMPAPFDDADWGGWMLHRMFSARFEFTDATAGVQPASWEYELDSKAMRKVGPNMTLAVIAQSQGGAFSVSIPLRVLVKLA